MRSLLHSAQITYRMSAMPQMFMYVMGSIPGAGVVLLPHKDSKGLPRLLGACFLVCIDMATHSRSQTCLTPALSYFRRDPFQGISERLSKFQREYLAIMGRIRCSNRKFSGGCSLPSTPWACSKRTGKPRSTTRTITARSRCRIRTYQ